MSMMKQIATGYDFEPLPDGGILIEFFGDDGVTFNTQVITKDCLVRLPIVAEATRIYIEHGKDAMVAFYDSCCHQSGR